MNKRKETDFSDYFIELSFFHSVEEYLHGVEHVTVGGETGRDARECNINISDEKKLF